MKVVSEYRLPIQIATSRVANELNALRERLERVEHGLEAVFLESESVPSGQTIGMLQELDVLQQSVGALADYLDKLSNLVNLEGEVLVDDAVKVVPLREMAARLKGKVAQSGLPGQPELF
ncbi:MAG: hypothetical protein ACRBB0_11430 [Pelagimonas sp.]|uniref:hypothetical protein n=1 Tax=Pelagimonas sp. TaxID=2073170 RepID=UPI003D6B7DD6